MTHDSSSPKRNLIADDVRELAMMLCVALTKRGYEVKTAEDGEQCLEMVREFEPHLLILDIMMPRVHGMEVMRRLKEDADIASVGVMICSARSFKPDRDQAMELGAVEFLTKPIKTSELCEKVDAYFNNSSPTTPVVAPHEAASEVYCPSLKDTSGYWRIWGSRGSIAVPDARFARYGGNTSCLEFCCGDQVMLIDAGTGIRAAGIELASQKPRNIPLFISHTHWDHIQGFPFFSPIYVPGFEVTLYGAPGFGKDLEAIFHGQLDRDYSSVEMSDLSAKLKFQRLTENPVNLGPIRVYWEMVNHPGATVGFRIQTDSINLAYITDNEFLQGYLGCPQDLDIHKPPLLDYKSLIDFVQGADVLIHEAQYTNEEYPSKVGWGHTSLSNACILAKKANVKHWIVTHHDPMHDDRMLQEKMNLTRHILRSLDCSVEVSYAHDGMMA